MSTRSSPPGRGPLSRQTLLTALLGVLVVVIGTYALLTYSTVDQVDDTVVQEAPLRDPTILPSQEAPTGAVDQPPSDLGEPVVPR